MFEFLSLLFSAALVNNVVLVQFLGISALFAYTHKLELAIELAWLGGCLLLVSSILNMVLFRYALTPLHLQVLQLPCFLAVGSLLTAGLLQLGRHCFAVSIRRQGLEFYVLSGNSAIVGFALLSTDSQLTTGNLIIQSFSAALGFAAILMLFAALRQRLDTADVPTAFRGAPIHLLSAGIVSMCLLGFAGIV